MRLRLRLRLRLIETEITLSKTTPPLKLLFDISSI
jgi:hypothetical protein